MSAKTKDERLNEVADEVLDLLDQFVSDTRCDSPTRRCEPPLWGKCGKCKWCKASELIQRIEHDPCDEESDLNNEIRANDFVHLSKDKG